MILKKIFVVLSIILVIILGLYFFRKFDFEKLLYKQSYNQSQKTCRSDSDCLLVQNSWCKTISSINKSFKEKWIKQNIEDTEKAKKRRQSCKLVPEEYKDINNFIAKCRKSLCFAEYKDVWETYKNNELQYEFKRPRNWLIPSSMEGSPSYSFAFGYPLKAGASAKSIDTYWISLNYISQSQLNKMGISYCGAKSDDLSRCEKIKIDGVNTVIDWTIPVEITLNEQKKDYQIKASVWIPHPKGGVVTFELQPVMSKSKEVFYKILTSFKFLND